MTPIISKEHMATIIPREQLLNGHLFQGSAYGGVPIPFFWEQLAPGEGPRLHVHPYDEIFVIQEGHATFTLGEREYGRSRGWQHRDRTVWCVPQVHQCWRGDPSDDHYSSQPTDHWKVG